MRATNLQPIESEYFCIKTVYRNNGYVVLLIYK